MADLATAAAVWQFVMFADPRVKALEADLREKNAKIKSLLEAKC